MTPRVFHSLVAALIRIGLLLALVIMLMAENAQAQPFSAQPVISQSVCGFAGRISQRKLPQADGFTRISPTGSIRAHSIA
jgi:hypothetical protein